MSRSLLEEDLTIWAAIFGEGVLTDVPNKGLVNES